MNEKELAEIKENYSGWSRTPEERTVNALLAEVERLSKENAQLRIDKALLMRGFSPTALAENERLNNLVEALAFVVEDETGMLSDAPFTAEKLEDILHTMKHRGEYANEMLGDYVKTNERLRAALDKIMHELGVPQPGYLAPVANAYYIARKALEGDK